MYGRRYNLATVTLCDEAFSTLGGSTKLSLLSNSSLVACVSSLYDKVGLEVIAFPLACIEVLWILLSRLFKAIVVISVATFRSTVTTEGQHENS